MRYRIEVGIFVVNLKRTTSLSTHLNDRIMYAKGIRGQGEGEGVMEQACRRGMECRRTRKALVIHSMLASPIAHRRFAGVGGGGLQWFVEDMRGRPKLPTNAQRPICQSLLICSSGRCLLELQNPSFPLVPFCEMFSL